MLWNYILKILLSNNRQGQVEYFELEYISNIELKNINQKTYLLKKYKWVINNVQM